MKPLHHLQWSTLGNKGGGGWYGVEGNLIPYKKYITTSAAVSVRRPFLPVLRRTVNAQTHFPGEKGLCTETGALLANFTDISQKLRGTFLCCSAVSGD